MKLPIFIIVLEYSFSVSAQGTFQDLNFEEANIVPIVGNPFYPYAVTVANALPGWSVYYGTVQQTVILYNDPTLGETAVTLYANGYPGFPGPIIDGNFSLLLQGGVIGSVPTPASISQTGQIPSGTHSLLFDVGVSPYVPLEPPEVLVGNQDLSLFPVGSGPNYTIFGGNISAWAGQTEQLTFSSPGGNYLIDDIAFSTQAVPEPSAVILTGIGGLLLVLWRRWFRQTSS